MNRSFPGLCIFLSSISLSLLSPERIVGATQATPGATLKSAFQNDFLIGVAINRKQFFEEDPRGIPIIKAQFNSISPENILKWQFVHPQPDKYDFEGPDRYVAFGESNRMAIIGHTLIWHSQTPAWVFRNADGTPVDRDTLLQRMHDHIQTVVGRYKGRIKGWDVVNEALYDSGTLRQSPWMKIIGEDYIAKAFQYAHEADPQADLHYNDYDLEKEPKRKGAIALLTKLKAQGIPVTAVGLQDHLKMGRPTPEEEDATIAAFAKLGLKVMITELDIDVVPATQRNRSADIAENAQAHVGADAYAKGLPESVQQALAKRYADMFAVFIKHRQSITRVTLWGVTDGDSWLNSGGRVNYPLLFDRNGQPKPAFDAVIRTAGTTPPAE
jgi:endo-1,4-beta-xylanase